MAVTYLARAGRRTLAEPSTGVRPAMPSRSPVADVDQRLNVDAFARHFGARPAAPPAAEDIEEPEEVRPTGIVPEPVSRRVPAKRIAAGRASSSQDVNGGSTEPRFAPSARTVAAAEVTPTQERKTVPERPRAKRAARERRDAAEHERSSDSQRISADPSRRRDLRSPVEIVRETHTVTSVRQERDVRDRARGDAPPRAALEPSMKSVLEAVKRAASWIEAGERRGEQSRAASPPDPPAPAPQARALARRPPPVTHLEIGRIDVEVVGPAKPAAPASRAQAGAPSSSAPGMSKSVFGWRQR
jgi:hypothetical protein